MNVVQLDEKRLEEAQEATSEASEIAKVTHQIVIKNNENYETAAGCLKEIKGKFRELDARKTVITKPLMTAKKEVDALFKPALTALSEAETTIKHAMAKYTAELEKQRRKALEEASKAVESGAKEEDIREFVKSAQVKAPAVAGIQVRIVKKYAILDESKIPEEFWLRKLDESKIGKAVRAGIGEIPGVKIWEENSIASRS